MNSNCSFSPPDDLKLLDLNEHDDSLCVQVMDENCYSTSALSMYGYVNYEAIPRIRVVVRKRPLNAKELENGDEDIIDVAMCSSTLVVNEPKTKVDLTKYTESHEFFFDNCLDQFVSNADVYKMSIQPLLATISRRRNATCFAYGQTGSGKTYTTQPLLLQAASDILSLLSTPQFLRWNLWISCFEIYGGKLFDLLNGRKKLEIREDGKRRICIVGIKEIAVQKAHEVKQLIEMSNSSRSTGSTGANADSSRSHAIMQYIIKPHVFGDNEVFGKLSFVDLAGSERGADTSDSNRQTRLEGAEINKSLLALKECIRALDGDCRHIPFRGSKLTEVLRDSFIDEDARTVMIANISPSSSSCEHTLNTLRYANRVKGLKRDKSKVNVNVQMGSSFEFSGKTADKSLQESVTVKANRECLNCGDAATKREIEEMTNELINLHRKEVEHNMSTIRKEMAILSEVDEPGSSFNVYVKQLSKLLDEKRKSIEILGCYLKNWNYK